MWNLDEPGNIYSKSADQSNGGGGAYSPTAAYHQRVIESLWFHSWDALMMFVFTHVYGGKLLLGGIRID